MRAGGGTKRPLAWTSLLAAALWLALSLGLWRTAPAGAQPRVPGSGAAMPDSLAALFTYDASPSPDLEVISSQSAGPGVVMQQVTYASPVAGRVTAILVRPAGASPPVPSRAAVLFLHWGQGDRSEFVSEAIILARAGAVSLLVDAPWNRPEPWTGIGESVLHPEQTRAMYLQNIIDLRRGVDLLQSLPGVDPRRIAYVGHSFGATWGGVLAAVEKRIGSFVLMGGLPSLTDPSLAGAPRYDEYMQMLQKGFAAEAWQRYCRIIEPLSGRGLVRYAAPSAVFFQFGLFDAWISRRAAEAYFEAASEPKMARWYPTSHEFNHLGATGDRLAWLQQRLGLNPVAPMLREMLPE